MNHLTRFNLIASLLAIFSLIGCTQKNSEPAGTSPSPAASDPAAASGSVAGDPCNLLTDAEVHDVFNGATAGKRDRSVDKYAIFSCVWDTPNDRLTVQTFAAKPGAVADELRSRVQGSIDPMLAGAADHIRYQSIAGIGDEAMMVVEKANPELGILADMALLATQRGDRVAILFTGTSLVSGDRDSALKALETLGSGIAKRL
ncbi:MAG: hypothetical protein SGI99_16775 [Pseudomonadota bacterium]|nr:hypothetical protein [Pseudomonadota bacterium]